MEKFKYLWMKLAKYLNVGIILILKINPHFQ